MLRSMEELECGSVLLIAVYGLVAGAGLGERQLTYIHCFLGGILKAIQRVAPG